MIMIIETNFSLYLMYLCIHLKALYPNVPIELIVSIGTGYYSGPIVGNYALDTLVNQVVAASVATENVHLNMKGSFSKDQYYRINPVLLENIPIDEKNKTTLNNLKRSGSNIL